MATQRRASSATHVPVMRRQVVESLALRPGLTVVDATVGAGGHSREIIPHITPGGRIIGTDRDVKMLALARATLSAVPCIYDLIQASYVELPAELNKLGVPHVDRVLADLGVSSDQLADPNRGFSVTADGPLDLRFNPNAGQPAHELIHQSSEEDLARCFAEHGEEPFSRQIAKAIIDRRRKSPILTARDLADVVVQAVSSRRKCRIHPATRVFQALRIVVNDELQQLSEFLDVVLPKILVPGGRAAVISFHSLEDRLVKQAFRQTDQWDAVTKGPIRPTAAEARNNPRSRSAKLRVAIRK